MRLFMLLPFSLALTTLPSCRKAEASPTTTGSDAFVVHEWGTFTSFQGSDGVTVDGMQHETEGLPGFVHSRLSAMASPLAVYGDPSRDVPVHHCQSKMETPVIYFHTKKPMHVKVDVKYDGLLTQWYPLAAKATPDFATGNPMGGTLGDLSKIKSSSLTWELVLTPPSMPRPSIPKVESKSDWQKAREVDAAFVTAKGGMTSKDESDQYVFYRGLNRTTPQPSILPSPTNDNDLTVMNSSSDALHAAFVVDMREGQGRFLSLGNVAPGARPATLRDVQLVNKETAVADLSKAMTTALEAEGLYTDEAKAMVSTWSHAWFSSVGTRVIYLVPRPVTDKILPLTITPAPDKLVRVIVGRIEFLTHTRRDEIATDILSAGSGKPLGNPEVHQALNRIGSLGRFAEPATRSVTASNPTPAMTAAASRVLGRVMRQY
jgi:hypothetical protein